MLRTAEVGRFITFRTQTMIQIVLIRDRRCTRCSGSFEMKGLVWEVQVYMCFYAIGFLHLLWWHRRGGGGSVEIELFLKHEQRHWYYFVGVVGLVSNIVPHRCRSYNYEVSRRIALIDISGRHVCVSNIGCDDWSDLSTLNYAIYFKCIGHRQMYQ